MPVAWELVVTWHGDPLRAELLRGKVDVAAAGPSGDDVPLALPDRQPLLRGDAAVLQLLPVGGATWSIDGQPVAGASTLSATEGVARLELGSLAVAVQGARAPTPFPRSTTTSGALLSVTAHAVATVLVGLVLTTEQVDEHRCFPHLVLPGTAPVLAHRPPPRRAPVAITPRWLSEERPDPVTPVLAHRAATRRRPRVGPVTPAPQVDAPAALPPLAPPAPWPPELDVDGVDPIQQLAPATRGGSGTGRRTARGGHGGGLGSCEGARFELLARRYGRATAILACSPGVQFERPTARGRRQDVVLRERGGTTLAPEVWTWSSD